MPVKTLPRPNEKQELFFRSTARFTAYGGARGGGKSWAVRQKAALLCLHYAGIRVLILRRTYPELRENHILPMQVQLAGIARYKETEKAFLFPNGSRLRFGYMDSEHDVIQYQGQEYDIIFLDEATQFTEFQFRTLSASIRGMNAFPKRMYLTCNPGGVGHAWVKRLFVDRDYREGENPADYHFIPARVFDNRALLARDDGYLQMLRSLPEDLRRAWLEGDWDIFSGQYFKEFRREVHVVRPFAVPVHWKRYGSLDYGRDMLAFYVTVLSPGGNAYVEKELYVPGLLVSEAAERIKNVLTDPIEALFAPPDLWNRHSDTGKSTADIFFEHGLMLTRVSNDRVQGWYELSEWLRPVRDEQGRRSSRLRIFDCCENLIRTLPALTHDEKNVNDTATTPHELTHAPDALRYFVCGRPLPPNVPDGQDSDERSMQTQIDGFVRYGL